MTDWIDTTSVSGVRARVFRDTDRGLVVRHDQETAPMIDANRREANDWTPAMQRNPGGFRKVASIPFVVMMQLCRSGVCEMTREGGFKVVNERDFLKVLSQRDLRGLRTDNGGRLA
jgi:hypothetical protein